MSNYDFFGIPYFGTMPDSGIPANADYINRVNSSINPSTVHVTGTGAAHFFRRYLLQKAISVFKWNLPKTWSRDYFLYILYYWGYIAVINTNKFGVIPQACGLKGYDIFYQPSTVTIANPLFTGLKELRIDKQCTLFKLQPDYGGIIDLVNFYGDMMALCMETAGVNLVNSKLSYVFFAKNKTQAETDKKLYDDIMSGNPAVVVDKDLLKSDGSVAWQPFQQNVGQNYIVGDVLADMRKLETMFDTDVGIPNANTDKKERLLTDEVNANNTETSSKCELWLEELQKSCAKTQEMFDISISVDWRNPPQTPIEKPKEVDNK